MIANNRGNILIAEDDEDIREQLAELLDSSGFKIFATGDGVSAIAKAAEIIPDVILLDVMMPAPDGFETCRRLKTVSATKDIPVIFMTALSDTANKVKGFKAGGIDYIIKPFEVDEIVARVDTHVTLHRLSQEKERLIRELEESLSTIRQLKGLLPICMYCKKIRNDKGYWEQVENYIMEHADVAFTHGLCEECCKKNYPELYDDLSFPIAEDE